jgi:hypothetical protein
MPANVEGNFYALIRDYTRELAKLPVVTIQKAVLRSMDRVGIYPLLRQQYLVVVADEKLERDIESPRKPDGAIDSWL